MPLVAVQKLTAQDFPPLVLSNQARPEDFLCRELLLAVNRSPSPTALWRHTAGSFVGLAGLGSDNHVVMASAIWALVDPDRQLNGLRARDWWIQLAKWYLGATSPAPPGDLCFFQASEPWSNDHDGLTVGSWLAVWDKALTDRDLTLAAAMERLVTTWAAGATLMSTWPTAGTLISHTLAGSREIHNPSHTLTRVPVGARSTNRHLDADPSALLLTELIGFPGTHPQPAHSILDFWYIQISSRRLQWLAEGVAADMRQAIIDHDLDAADRVAAVIPHEARWKGNFGIEIRRWRDGTVVGVVPKVLNSHTAWIPVAVARPNNPAEAWFPWPRPRAGDLGSGKVSEKGGKLIVSSGFGTLPPLDLPSAAPSRIYRFNAQGFKRVSGEI